MHASLFSPAVCSAGGGKGLIAMQVFSFIGLTAVLFMTTVRILGASISFLEPTRKVSCQFLFASSSVLLIPQRPCACVCACSVRPCTVFG